jgi:hypothetical protein
VWELHSKNVQLADHVGHTVTVTGSTGKGSKAQEEKIEANEKKEPVKRNMATCGLFSLTESR